MGGTIDYIYRDGSRLTPWMLHVINQANTEFKAKFGCELLVSSGIRTNQEQRDIFLSKFRVEWFSNGPYNDVRWWGGKRYVRYGGGGTVAVPGTSNHEVQGSKAAVDLRDSGEDAGVATGFNERADWLRYNAPRLGLIASGYGFGEPWHYDVPDIFRTPPAAAPAGGNSKPVIIPSEEDSMFIAIIKKKDWYLVIGKEACLLGAASGARGSGAPILKFDDDWAVNQLKTIVAGIK